MDDPGYLDGALGDAERLVAYAAGSGLVLEQADVDVVIKARGDRGGGWTREHAAGILTTLTRIAGHLKPVTTETLRACQDCASVGKAMRLYRRMAVGLAAIIVPFSCVSFVTSGMSDAIRKDITAANELAVKVTTQLRAAPAPPGEAAPGADPRVQPISSVDLTELQHFAATIRALDGRSVQLNRFLVFFGWTDPFADIRAKPEEITRTFELPVPLTNPKAAADGKIETYQRVRYFAQGVLDTTSVLYGAATVCVLPALYALLGATAYLIRSFEQQIKIRTFAPSNAHSARFVIAAIGGVVVGLFNSFSVSQGASISPLGIAFLVGYAVDVFFSFLDGLLQTFAKPSGEAGAPRRAAG